MNKLNLVTIGILSMLCCAGALAQSVVPDPVKLEYLSPEGKVVYTTSDSGYSGEIFRCSLESQPGYYVYGSYGRFFSSIRFTPWAEVGDQPVVMVVAEEAPEGMTVTYELVADNVPALTAPHMHKMGEEMTLPPGTHLRCRIDLPAGYVPVMNFNYNQAYLEGDVSMPEEGWDFVPVTSHQIQNYLSQKSNRSWTVSVLESEEINGFKRVEGTVNSWTREIYTGMLPEKYVFSAKRMDAEALCGQLLVRAFDKMFGMFSYMDICNGQQWHNGESFIMAEIGDCMSQDAVGDAYFLSSSQDWHNAFSMTDWAGNWVWHSWTWNYAMELIQSANFGLRVLDEYTACTPEEMAMARAQLLVLRAHGYWRLLQAYAPRWEDSGEGSAYCAPWYDKFDAVDRPLATMNEIFSHLYDDLGEACEALKHASAWSMSNLPDYQTASGVWARIALLRHDWQKAAECAREARTHSSKYRISSNEELLGGYIEPNADWMWCSQPYVLVFGGSSVRWACNGYFANMVENAVPPGISKDLFDSMEDGDVRRRLFLSPGNPDFPDLSTPIFSRIGMEQDQAAVWIKSTYMNNQLAPKIAGQAEARGLGHLDTPYEVSPYHRPLGAHLKFFTRGLMEPEQVLFMRSTEMLLTEAEALCEQGKDAEALALVNTLHKLRTGNELAASDHEAVREAIRLERRLELWGEGFGWFDFKRWNLSIHRSVEAGFGTGAAAETNPSDANGWRFKIPAREVLDNVLIDVKLMNYSDYSMYETQSAAPATSPTVSQDRALAPDFSLTR